MTSPRRSRRRSRPASIQTEAPERTRPAREAALTPSQQRVLEALMRGLSNKEIAAELWLTQHTVKFHLTNIYRRLGVSNRTEAIRYAYKHRLVAHPVSSRRRESSATPT
jgi:DNA-binding NarL/FixJ family response regulator